MYKKYVLNITVTYHTVDFCKDIDDIKSNHNETCCQMLELAEF